MFLRLAEQRISVRAKGSRWDDGRPVLVCIHGAGGNNTHWLGQFRSLSADFHLLLVDLPGHGKSQGPAKKSVSEYSAWLRQFLISMQPGLNPDRVILVGHSLGGAIAMDYVMRGYPATGLVLVSTGARMRVSSMIFEMLGDAAPGLWADAAVDLMFGAEAPPDLRDASRRELASTSADLYRNDFQAADAWDAMERLQQVTVPTQVICGTTDMMTPAKYAQYLADEIPDARLKLLDGIGHMPMLEAAEAVTTTLRQFVCSLADSSERMSSSVEPKHERPFTPLSSDFEGDPK